MKNGNKNFVKYLRCLFIPMAIILYVIAFYALGFYLQSRGYLKKYDFKNPVKAVYTDVRLTYFNSGYVYELIYEYTAPDGTVYTGHSSEHYNKHNAQSHIGEEVEIYIDGKGGSTLHNYGKDNRQAYLIVAIVFIPSATVIAVTAVILYKRKPRIENN